MIFKTSDTVEDTLGNWSKQLIIETNDSYKLYDTEEDTLKEWARRLNSLNISGKAKQIFRTHEDSSQTITEWANQLNIYFN